MSVSHYTTFTVTTVCTYTQLHIWNSFNFGMNTYIIMAWYKDDTYIGTHKSKYLQYTRQGIPCIQLYTIASHDEYVAIPVHTDTCAQVYRIHYMLSYDQ